MSGAPQPFPVLLMARELGIGGCERDLARLACALTGSRYRPHVGCFRTGGLRHEELSAAGVPIVPFPVQSLIGISGIKGAVALRQYLKAHGIRLVHTFDAPTAIFAAPVARLLETPIIVSNLWYRSRIQTRLRYGLRLADRLADAIVVNSKAVQDHLIRDEGVRSGKVRLCYNGVDTKAFHPGATIGPEALPSAPLVIGCVCALRPEKRLNLLLESFAAVRALLPGMKLLIVGSGEMLDALQALRQRLGLEDSCIFEPAAKDVSGWIRAMDIFVLASDTESFPNALLEAMACGCAVVASRVGGIPELVDDGVSGLLFGVEKPEELTGKLSALIRNAPLRQRLGASAAARAREHFSMENSVACVTGIYEEVLDPRTRGPLSSATGRGMSAV